jgi:hypothetical protein
LENTEQDTPWYGVLWAEKWLKRSKPRPERWMLTFVLVLNNSATKALAEIVVDAQDAHWGADYGSAL